MLSGIPKDPETEALADMLAYTSGVISKSSEEQRASIASAYQEARELAASIQSETNSVRPSIEACLIRFEELKAQGDFAPAGWMLTAVQERLWERNLPGWQLLTHIVDESVNLLPVENGTIL
jgi:hypothetical protein